MDFLEGMDSVALDRSGLPKPEAQGGLRPTGDRDEVVFIAAKMEGQVAQFAMRPEGIVLVAVILDHHTSLGESPELLPVETFIPESSVEALNEAILIWLSLTPHPFGAHPDGWLYVAAAPLTGTTWINGDRLDAVLLDENLFKFCVHGISLFHNGIACPE